MNPVTEYIKNMGKSVGYATIDHISQKSPAAASFAESNQQLFKDVFHSIRDYKTTIQKTKDLLQNTPVYKMGDLAFNNAIEDIKSGKLYNKEREDASFGDFGDFDSISGDMDFSDMEGFSGTITEGDTMVVKSIQSSSERNAYAVTNAVASSTQYLADTNKSIANIQYAQGARTINTVKAGFTGLS